MPVLATEVLQTAMARARSGEASGGWFGARRSDPLAALKSAISTAERENVVDGAMIQEAKVLLATQTLRNAMERRDVAGLRAAIVAAEGEAEVDVAVVEVSVEKRCMGSAIRAQYFSVAPNTTQHDLSRPAPPAHLI